MAHKHHQQRSRRYSRNRRELAELYEYTRLLTMAKRITAPELKRLIDEGSNPLIIDVRETRDYKDSDIRIKGDIRVRPARLHDLVDTLARDRLIVTY